MIIWSLIIIYYIISWIMIYSLRVDTGGYTNPENRRLSSNIFLILFILFGFGFVICMVISAWLYSWIKCE